MHILISGSHGFIGSALYDHLTLSGHTLRRLIRPTQVARSDEISWNPDENSIHHTHLGGIDAVIHLAGETIFGRWTKAKKEKILRSRVQATAFLCKQLVQMPCRPAVLICASAIGYYGSRGQEELTESSQAGGGFLSHVCWQTEAAAEPARQAGIRVVSLRFGMVLGKNGGALGKMLPLFKLGLGGPLGDGTQWVSWICLNDAIDAIAFALNHASLEGPVNIVAPEAVRNQQFAQLLGQALHRPAILPVPRQILRLILGELADEALLSSTRVVPAALMQAGFTFRCPNLPAALDDLLNRR